jgi:hypothetical protein
VLLGKLLAVRLVSDMRDKHGTAVADHSLRNDCKLVDGMKHRFPTKFARHLCGAPSQQFWPPGVAGMAIPEQLRRTRLRIR